MLKGSKLWCSTESVEGENEDGKSDKERVDFLGKKGDVAQPHGVDPRRGWDFRGVHKVYIMSLL